MTDAQIAQVLQGLTDLRTEIHSLREELQHLRDEQVRARAVREARAALDEELAGIPRRVDGLAARVEAVEAKIEAATRPPVAHDRPDTRPRIWESEDGRRVIWWACAAVVASALAVGGGLTFADLTSGATVGVSVEGAP